MVTGIMGKVSPRTRAHGLDHSYLRRQNQQRTSAQWTMLGCFLKNRSWSQESTQHRWWHQWNLLRQARLGYQSCHQIVAKPVSLLQVSGISVGLGFSKVSILWTHMYKHQQCIHAGLCLLRTCIVGAVRPLAAISCHSSTVSSSGTAQMPKGQLTCSFFSGQAAIGLLQHSPACLYQRSHAWQIVM